MASVAMLVGGALVNALAFSRSKYLFSRLSKSGVDEERKRNDTAVEQLQAAQAEWSRKRTERLDWINAELRCQRHAVETFRDVDAALREYARIFHHQMADLPFLRNIGPEPKLSDFHVPSEGQKNREITFIVLGMAATGLVAYNLERNPK